MMNVSRKIGDNHVKDVFTALVTKLQGNEKNYGKVSPIANKTADHILNKFPKADRVENKFQSSNPDMSHDLTIYCNNEKTNINLFFAKGNGRIQPKNLGAKSFLRKYFLSGNLQDQFNNYIDLRHKVFFSELIKVKEGNAFHYGERKYLRAKVKQYYDRFDENINVFRERFLYEIREYCFNLIQSSYNQNKQGFENAYRTLLMLDEVNIITRVLKGSIRIEEFNPTVPSYENIRVYKKGNSSIGIQFGQVSLLLRFKFENKPYSSVKLATSYEFFNSREEFNSLNKRQNRRTIKNVDQLLQGLVYVKKGNVSNAIGKTHESLTYYWFLHRFPTIVQTKENDCLDYVKKYTKHVKPETLEKIQKNAVTTVDTIMDYITRKYESFKIQSVQLVADIYVKDKLNTGDIKIGLKLGNGNLEEVFISLKAIAKSNQKITTKNPGFGSILGPNYFNTGEMGGVAETLKEEFEGNRLSREECLKKASEEIGSKLNSTSQVNLRKGLQSLLGKALMVIGIYQENQGIWVEHEEIKGEIEVYPLSPSEIQNTLSWNSGSEQLNLRVKFSKGKRHGWSSIKLTSEYQVRREQQEH